MRNTMLPMLVILPFILFSIAGNTTVFAGETELRAATKPKQKPRSLNIPKLKEPLRISRYQCEHDLTRALVMNKRGRRD